MRPCFRMLRIVEMGVRNREPIYNVAVVKERNIRIIECEYKYQYAGQYLFLLLWHRITVTSYFAKVFFYFFSSKNNSNFYIFRVYFFIFLVNFFHFL
jgi:hypothetical protein